MAQLALGERVSKPSQMRGKWQPTDSVVAQPGEESQTYCGERKAQLGHVSVLDLSMEKVGGSWDQHVTRRKGDPARLTGGLSMERRCAFKAETIVEVQKAPPFKYTSVFDWIIYTSGLLMHSGGHLGWWHEPPLSG